MTHVVIGLFADEVTAGKAVATLLDQNIQAEDISLIAKNQKTGKVNVHQVKETLKPGEMKEAKKGAEVGGIAGVIGGISTIIHPVLLGLGAVGAVAAAMGIAGASLGALGGGLVGAENEEALPPERAAQFTDRIHKGEVLVSVATSVDMTEQLRKTMTAQGANEIEVMQTKD